MKASFNVNSIKEICTGHAEKFIFGGVILLLLLFAVRAVQTVRGGGPPCTCAELVDAAKRARQHWESTQTDDYLTSVNLKATPYDEIAGKIRDPIPEEPYQWKVILNESLWPQRNKRAEPGLIALKDLRTAAGHGAVTARSGAAGAGTGERAMSARGAQGQRWVVVTGLVPIEEQTDAFKVTFEDALFRNPQLDVPIYLGYRIERAEVTDSSAAGQLKWKPIDPRRGLGMQATSSRAMGEREVVHAKYIALQPQNAIPLVYPLPPVTNTIWGPEVAHHPEIPLLVDMPESERRGAGTFVGGSTTEEGEPAEATGETDATEPEEGADEFEAFPGPGVTGAGGLGGRSDMGGAGPFAPGGPGMPGMPGMPGGMPGMPGMPGTGATSNTMMPSGGEMGYGFGRPGGSGTIARVEKLVKYQLFRFFDFSVEPGRHYRYRVQLVLANPNYSVEPRFLEQEDLGKKSWTAAAWSDPTEVVAVPRDSQLLAGSVKAPRTWPGILYEPTASVLAVTIRMEDGLEAAQEYSVYRGHLANFEGTVAKEARRGALGAPGGTDAMMMMGETMAPAAGAAGDERPRRAEKDGEEEEEEKISHATGMLVLDMAGGNRLNRTDRTLTEPGSLLLLDPDGNLLIRDELDDQDEYVAYHAPEEEKRPKRTKDEREDEMKPGMPGMPGMPGAEAAMEGMYGMGRDADAGGRRGDKKRGNTRKTRNN